MNYLILYNISTKKYSYIAKGKFEKLRVKPRLIRNFEVVGQECVSTQRDLDMLKRVISRLTKTFRYLESGGGAIPLSEPGWA